MKFRFINQKRAVFEDCEEAFGYMRDVRKYIADALKSGEDCFETLLTVCDMLEYGQFCMTSPIIEMPAERLKQLYAGDDEPQGA